MFIDKGGLKCWVFLRKIIFKYFEGNGMQVLPNNSICYELPIPDLKKLDEAFWSKRSELVGVSIRERRGDYSWDLILLGFAAD
jgi:hypothetical protein